MKLFTFSLILSFLSIAGISQDTFSIVAVDTITGEIGSAGASCLDNNAIAGGAVIISDVLPGRGAIHTQSYWLSANQINAHNQMENGLSPQEIIDWLIANDVQNQPAIRQYGIVDFDPDGHARSAAFTGENCFDWKGHILGPNYSIQGNILLSNAIIDSIEARFLREEGSFADKLMAALQGAKVPGADSRCAPEGVSSLSAFLRVAKTTNSPDSLYLDLNVPETPYGVEPIDVLQNLYDDWKMLVNMNDVQIDKQSLKLFPNPGSSRVHYEIKQMNQAEFDIIIADMSGRKLALFHQKNAVGEIDISNLTSGTYLIYYVSAEKTAKPCLFIKQ